MENDELKMRIKKAIIDRLGLDIDPEKIDDAAPLFAKLTEGTEYEDVSLNLDSIDILEIVLALNNEFDLDISDEDYESFKSVDTLAEYISKAHEQKK